MQTEFNLMPMIAMRGVVGFPHTVMNIEVARDASLNSISRAMKSDRMLFLATQKDMRQENPSPSDLYEIGIVAKIRQVLKQKDHYFKVLIEGVSRARCIEAVMEDCFVANVEFIDEESISDDETDACMRALVDKYQEYGEVSGKVTPEAMLALKEIKNPTKLADTVALNCVNDVYKKQELLETLDVKKRMMMLMEHLEKEQTLYRLASEINMKTQASIDKSQKEMYLREQMRSIQNALGEDDATEEKMFEQRINELPVAEEMREKLLKELSRLKKLNPQTPDYAVLRTYLDWVTTLPFGVYTTDSDDIDFAQEILERDHFGMQKVKERIIEYLAVLSLKKDMKGPILCLAGPPGVGKTSIAKSVAEALGRKFVRMSLGGVRDEAEIRGHRRTYVGAIPGRIISEIKKAGTMNPVFLLDEIDKMASDFRGDPASAMLEVLDPEINSGFQDHYLDIDFDLSNVLFLTTANDVDSIPRPLYDRMEIIEVSGYTEYEKAEIAKRHLVPKVLEQHGLSVEAVTFLDGTIEKIISGYTAESGVRALEREIASVARKCARKYIKDHEHIDVVPEDVAKYLGPEKFTDSKLPKTPSVGVSVGLAWTAVGGVTMPVEVTVMKGNGSLELTGQLGDVMKESAKTGLSLVRACAQSFGVEQDFHETKDIHIHVPEGAVHKDGPSAGITMVTAMVSALSGRPVRNDIAMTGEITLTGRVLPIGGLKEKSLAAVRAGISKVIIPADNVKDIEEIPEAVRNGVEFFPVSEIKEVLERVLL